MSDLVLGIKRIYISSVSCRFMIIRFYYLIWAGFGRCPAVFLNERLYMKYTVCHITRRVLYNKAVQSAFWGAQQCIVSKFSSDNILGMNTKPTPSETGICIAKTFFCFLFIVLGRVYSLLVVPYLKDSPSLCLRYTWNWKKCLLTENSSQRQLAPKQVLPLEGLTWPLIQMLQNLEFLITFCPHDNGHQNKYRIGIHLVGTHTEI